jgi:hypothetical protein
MITHGDPEQRRVAAFGTRAGSTRARADRDRWIHPVAPAGDAEIMTVCAGAIGLDPEVAADPQLDCNVQAILALRSGRAEDSLGGLRTIRSHHLHRKGM